MIYLGCTATEDTHHDLRPITTVKVIILLASLYSMAEINIYTLYNLNYSHKLDTENTFF